MRLYLFTLATLLLFVSASSLKAQIVNIPDAVFKNHLIGTTVNTNFDSEIQISEAQSYTGLINITGLNITDITGLEAFVNLTELRCFGNALTSLDISANTLLTKLYCGGNNLTSLDVSNNVNLTDLECSLLKITQLDLSNNVNLTALDFRGDSLLTMVNLKNGNNTAITNTNFKGESNPALICVEVDNVVYSTGNWTNIDAASVFSANCFLSITETNNLPNLQVYPNPTQNNLTIDLGTTHSSIAINVSNAIGQRTQSTTYTNTQALDLNIEGLPGWYFIQIKTEKGNKTIKVLKQ
jgi:hypothetical protein